MTILELRHLKTIQAMERFGTLTAAADHLFVTQSALSHQIKDLEHHLGVALYHRKTKPLKITQAGQILLNLANRVLPEIQAVEDELVLLEQGHSGRLYMAIECHSCFDWLMPAISRYRENWPDIELDFSTGFHFDPLPALRKGELDLVLTSDPDATTGIYYHPLFKYESLLAMSNDHHLLGKKSVEPADLRDENLITYPVERDRLDIFRKFLDPAAINPKSVRKAELTLMMIQLVASSRGVACLPNWVLKDYLDAGVISARKFSSDMWSVLYLAIREEQKNLPFMVEFFETARTVCFSNLFGIKPVIR